MSQPRKPHPHNPQFPIYIVSKGRADTRLTALALERMGVPYFIVIEAQEYPQYSAVIDPARILILDKRYQEHYDTCDNLCFTKSKGPGAARNFAWDDSIKRGYSHHWVMDDNIRCFYRMNNNKRIRVSDGTIFKCMEDFVLRYSNVAMSGPNYFTFAPRRTKHKPFCINTRIYSCNLIRNDTPFRWRGRYNEDTDLSIRMLKAGWCTIQFYAFLQEKMVTQALKGGNTEAFYAKEGTTAKSQMQVALHPDISRIVWKFGRVHHHVDYTVFKKNKLIRIKDPNASTMVNNYGMELVKI